MPKKKKKINKNKKFVKKYFSDEVGLLYILAGVIFLCALGLLFWFSYNYFTQKSFFNIPIVNFNKDKEEREGSDCEFKREIDGVCVNSEKDVLPELVTVMIENHVDARPQSGLVDASVVYEAPVEANYSRFLVVYPADKEIEKIGPVRSSRPYYLDWVSEYGNPVYMHVGGSNEALALINKYDIFSINEMVKGWYFWRSKNRYAPHNTYTSSDLWKKVLSDYKDQQSIFNNQVGWWSFTSSSKQAVSSTLVNEIKVSFLPPAYEVTWKFNSSTGKYDRYQIEGLHRDQDGRKIKADTIIIQHVESWILDEVGRQAIKTLGKGEVEVFYNGLIFKGTWKKESRTARTKFYNENGEEIKLKPGKIWIEIINQRGDISWSGE